MPGSCLLLVYHISKGTLQLAVTKTPAVQSTYLTRWHRIVGRSRNLIVPGRACRHCIDRRPMIREQPVPSLHPPARYSPHKLRQWLLLLILGALCLALCYETDHWSTLFPLVPDISGQYKVYDVVVLATLSSGKDLNSRLLNHPRDVLIHHFLTNASPYTWWIYTIWRKCAGNFYHCQDRRIYIP